MVLSKVFIPIVMITKHFFAQHLLMQAFIGLGWLCVLVMVFSLLFT